VAPTKVATALEVLILYRLPLLSGPYKGTVRGEVDIRKAREGPYATAAGQNTCIAVSDQTERSGGWIARVKIAEAGVQIDRAREGGNGQSDETQ